MTERHYLVGLPVDVAVYDGRVHLSVDAAELASALERYDDEHPYTDEQMTEDIRTVQRAFTALVEGEQVWRITADTMQHHRGPRAVRRIRRAFRLGRA